jgi:hypothetical protein
MRSPTRSTPRSTLDPDDKDYARLQGWLEDLAVVKGGGVPGKF